MPQKSTLHRLAPLLILLGLFLGLAGPARADDAPLPPAFGSAPQGASDNTQVQLVSEKVTLDVDPFSRQKFGSAKVNAAFQLQNTGSQQEDVQIRFPLSPTVFDGSACYYSKYPPISDLTIFLQNIQIRPPVVKQSVTTGLGKPATLDIPCWVQFTNTFLIQQIWDLKTKYTVSGYSPDETSGTVEYNFVQQGAAKWASTVNSADIVLRLPYDADAHNVVSCQVGDTPCKISGKELSWHQSDWEPDGSFIADITNPVLWKAVLDETNRTTVNPKDYYSWGRLGQAYKQVIWTNNGFRQDPAGVEMYGLSVQAYQKGIQAKADNPDLHAGLAELLCWKDQTDMADGVSNVDWSGCFQELNLALSLRKDQALALKILQQVSAVNPGWVDLTPTQPVFLGLTATPTLIASVTPTQAPSPTITATLAATATTEATATSLPASPTAAAATQSSEASPTLAPSPTTAAPAARGGPQLGWIGLFVLIMVGGSVVAWRAWKK